MVINLTQHQATPEQIAAGVVDLPPNEREELCRLLTFSAADLAANPSAAPEVVTARAQQIVSTFVVPRVASAARTMIGDTLAHSSDVELLRILRPEAAAAGMRAMIGGAPYLMAPLERALRAAGVEPVYALSERVSTEEAQPDGSVRKVNTFRHVGFVSATVWECVPTT